MDLKIKLFLLFQGLHSFLCLAQFSANGPAFWEKVRYGGRVGLGFTNNGFNGSISPSAIYQVNNQFAAGSSVSFYYARFNATKFLTYGGSILTLYNPIPQLQISSAYEQLRINRILSSSRLNVEENYWLPALCIGLGYSTYNLTFGLRYDLLYTKDKSMYPSAMMPFVRVFFKGFAKNIP